MIADAFARSAPGNSRESIAVPTGVIIPPPMPCRKRNAMSCSSDCASPQSADADDEDRHRQQEDPLRAEAVREQSGRRDEHRQAQ